MLDLTGDILNWLAAGVVFPLMLLPLAALVFSARNSTLVATMLWAVLTALVAGAGVLFLTLAPRMEPALPGNAYWLAGFALLSAIIVAALGGPAKASGRLSVIAEPVVRVTGRIVMWLLILMALVQFAVVVLRYVFGVNFIFMQESITYMHGAVFLLAGGYALLTDDHVRVDIFYRGASKRKKALVDFIGSYLLLFPLCLLLFWTASPYVATSWSVGEGSAETSGIQGVFILKSFIPAYALLLAMAGFVIAARAGDILRERG